MTKSALSMVAIRNEVPGGIVRLILVPNEFSPRLVTVMSIENSLTSPAMISVYLSVGSVVLVGNTTVAVMLRSGMHRASVPQSNSGCT